MKKDKFVTKDELDARFARHDFLNGDYIEGQISLLKRQIENLSNRVTYMDKIMKRKVEPKS